MTSEFKSSCCSQSQAPNPSTPSLQILPFLSPSRRHPPSFHAPSPPPAQLPLQKTQQILPTALQSSQHIQESRGRSSLSLLSIWLRAMSGIVFHSTTAEHSVESQSMEPLTLRLKLASPWTAQPFGQFSMKPTSEFACSGERRGSPELGVWDFLKIPERALFSDSPFSSCPPSPSSYSCYSSLSDKSLELCTENLGNETGCVETSEDSLFSSIPSPVSSDQYENSPRRSTANKEARPRSFPPPLTTIRGGKSIQFRSSRQDGRLLIEAVRAPPAHRTLQAERNQGRLRLCFLGEPASPSEPEPLDCQERHQQEVDEEEEKVEMEEERVDADCRGGDVDERNENSGVRMGGMEMLARTGRRCTEGGGPRARVGCWVGGLSWWLHLEFPAKITIFSRPSLQLFFFSAKLPSFGRSPTEMLSNFPLCVMCPTLQGMC